jgi:hypothetical protein
MKAGVRGRARIAPGCAPCFALCCALCLVAGCGWLATAAAQSDPGDVAPNTEVGAFSFAVVASDTTIDPARTGDLLHAIDQGTARFVVHAEASSSSCSDAALEARWAILDASMKPVVPIASGSEWTDCANGGSDPFERLQHVDDVFFATDRSLGQTRMSWSRQSAVPRFRRYRENLRWQWGRVLFATVNVPDNNNDFRLGAGRNGEFEDRTVANRAWLERTFRLASERKLPGVVLFIDAAPRFGTPLRPPDTRSRDRDGYYEWKLALREFVAAYKGRVLLVQARHEAGAPRPAGVDRPLRDAAGRPLENLLRVAAPEADGDARWLRVEVDPADPVLFRVTVQRVFDDPSGELYGPGPMK